jgi:hypothetical protein
VFLDCVPENTPAPQVFYISLPRTAGNKTTKYRRKSAEIARPI